MEDREGRGGPRVVDATKDGPEAIRGAAAARGPSRASEERCRIVVGYLDPGATTTGATFPSFAVVDADRIAAVWLRKQSAMLKYDVHARIIGWDTAAWSDPVTVATDVDQISGARVAAVDGRVAIFWVRSAFIGGRTYDASLSAGSAAAERSVRNVVELRDYEVVGVPGATPHFLLLTVDRPFSTSSSFEAYADRVMPSPLTAEMRRVVVSADDPQQVAAAFQRASSGEARSMVVIASATDDTPAEVVVLNSEEFGSDIAVLARATLPAARGSSSSTMTVAAAAGSHGADALSADWRSGFQIVWGGLDGTDAVYATDDFGSASSAHAGLAVARLSSSQGAAAYVVQSAGGAMTDAWLQRLGCE